MAAIDIGKTLLQTASLEEESGLTSEARLTADRPSLHAWVDGFQGRLKTVAIEATTGWKWIAYELQARGVEVLLLDPGEASAKKGFGGARVRAASGRCAAPERPCRRR